MFDHDRSLIVYSKYANYFINHIDGVTVYRIACIAYHIDFDQAWVSN